MPDLPSLETLGLRLLGIVAGLVAWFVTQRLIGERRLPDGGIYDHLHSIDWTFFTPFQREALQAVFRIAYGETRTYIDIAREIDHPRAYRAVGAANAMNPIPIIIPCHRVLATDGKLHGYGGRGGLRTKEWLLKMEGAVMA